MQEVKTNNCYVILWNKQMVRVVTGAFVRGHFDKCIILSEPNVHINIAKKNLRTVEKSFKFFSVAAINEIAGAYNIDVDSIEFEDYE